MYKPTKTRNWLIKSSPKLHINCHFKNTNSQKKTPYRKQVVHPRHKTPRGEPVAKPGTLLHRPTSILISVQWIVVLIHQLLTITIKSLRWRHNGCDSVSNHQPHQCLLNRLFRRRSKKTSKLRVTGLCAGNSPGTGEFPAQMASYAENASIWWRHHVRQWFNMLHVLATVSGINTNIWKSHL